MKRLEKVDSFANRLKSSLKSKKLSQNDLSRLLGISRQRVSQYVNGKFQPKNYEIISKISKILNVNEVWLLGYDEISIPQNHTGFIKTCIEKIYGNQAVFLLEFFLQLNEEDKKNVLSYVKRLNKIKKYIDN